MKIYDIRINTACDRKCGWFGWRTKYPRLPIDKTSRVYMPGVYNFKSIFAPLLLLAKAFLFQGGV